jgi:hypothetical protein
VRDDRSTMIWRRRAAITVALGLAVGAAALPSAVIPVGPAAAAQACTQPPPPDQLGAATPSALRQRYGIDDLLAAGHDGRGQVGVILEFGQSVDAQALGNWEACLSTGSPSITQTALPPGSALPLPGGEAQADAQSMVTGAPGLDQLYSLVYNGSEVEGLPILVAGILDGSLTGGRRADVVSLSFGTCEQQWVQQHGIDSITHAIEPLLQRLAEAGIWFFKAAGDAGSSDCSPHTADPNCVNNPSDTQLAAGYPASSPWVTSVGGLEYKLASGELRDPVVWNSTVNDPTDCSAGGGVTSSIFTTPAYQSAVPGGAVPPMRGVPDIAALAGAPYYLSYLSTWYGNGGTSFAAPLYAGAAASVRSALTAAGAPIPNDFNTALYAIANDPKTYATVFKDIQTGNNSIYAQNACCTAAKGYDLASGLGELNASALADVLLLQATTPTTSTTAPAPGATIPTAVIATPRFTG